MFEDLFTLIDVEFAEGPCPAEQNVGLRGTSGNSVPALSESAQHTVHIIARIDSVRAAMARLVGRAGHLVETFSEPRELVEQNPTDGIILIHEADDCGAVELIRALAQKALWMPVIGFGSSLDVRKMLDGMKAGAVDYLVENFTEAELNSRLDGWARKAKAVSALRQRCAAARVLLAKLSKREAEVLDLVAQGLSSKEIAARLGRSPRTVDVHRLRLLSKLEASSTVQALTILFEARTLPIAY